MVDTLKALIGIVGEHYVSNQKEELYFYGREPGICPPHEPDYVVMPETTEQVQEIVRLANRYKVPITAVGGGLDLSGLIIPHRGGILLDMKRMGKILEVNEKAKYVIVEGGTTHGALQSYLRKHHPHLRHSMPDSPPIATVVGNAMIHGQGVLTQQYGFNSEMVTGLEVVLPTGELCKIGSCSVSSYWFSKGPPLPDLTGLFLGWFGTTGIITKMGLRLYPCKRIRDVLFFVTDRADLVPDIFLKLSHTEVVEDILVGVPPRLKNIHNAQIFLTADSYEELDFKKHMVWNALRDYYDSKDGGFMPIPMLGKAALVEMPLRDGVSLADVRRGGGFVYGGAIAPIEKYPVLATKVGELSAKYNLFYDFAARSISGGLCMMVPALFLFNRADSDEIERVRRAMHDIAVFYIEQGAVIWKPNLDEQEMTMARMDPNTLNLMRMIRRSLDSNGIMNPGNWDIK